MDTLEPDWLKYGPMDIEYQVCDKCGVRYKVKYLAEFKPRKFSMPELWCKDCIAEYWEGMKDD